MCSKQFVSMKKEINKKKKKRTKTEIMLLINVIMERFLKVALELLKQALTALKKMKSNWLGQCRYANARLHHSKVLEST